MKESFEKLFHWGHWAAAETLSKEALEIAKPGSIEAAAILDNLGNILRMRGDLEGAEAMHRCALEIDEKLGRLDGMANAYGNLGNILRTRGDLDAAEAMLRHSLEINDKLGRREAMAPHYGTLGLILKTRGDLGACRRTSRRFFRESGTILQKLRINDLRSIRRKCWSPKI